MDNDTSSPNPVERKLGLVCATKRRGSWLLEEKHDVGKAHKRLDYCVRAREQVAALGLPSMSYHGYIAHSASLKFLSVPSMLHIEQLKPARRAKRDIPLPWSTSWHSLEWQNAGKVDEGGGICCWCWMQKGDLTYCRPPAARHTVLTYRRLFELDVSSLDTPHVLHHHIPVYARRFRAGIVTDHRRSWQLMVPRRYGSSQKVPHFFAHTHEHSIVIDSTQMVIIEGAYGPHITVAIWASTLYLQTCRGSRGGPNHLRHRCGPHVTVAIWASALYLQTWGGSPILDIGDKSGSRGCSRFCTPSTIGVSAVVPMVEMPLVTSKVQTFPFERDKSNGLLPPGLIVVMAGTQSSWPVVVLLLSPTMAKTRKIKKSNASTKVQPSKVTTTAPKTAPSKVPLNRVEGSKIQGKHPRRKQRVADPSSSENEDVKASESEKEQPKRKKPKAAESLDEDSFNDTSEEEANERPTVPLPHVIRSQAAKETIDVDKIDDDSQQDGDDNDNDNDDTELLLEAAQRLSASGCMSSKIVAPPPKRPQVLTTEASMVFNPTKASKDKVPATFEIKGSTPAGSDDHVFLDLPQSPTASIHFNDLEWGDKRNDWAPASTTLPATYKDSAFNHPPPGEPLDWGKPLPGGRLQRSKHKSFYHDYVSVFNPVNKTYHPLPNGFIPPQPGVIPSLNDLRRDAKLRHAERVDPPSSSPAPTTIPTIHSGTQATEHRHTEVGNSKATPSTSASIQRPLLSASSARLAAGLAAEHSLPRRGEPGLAPRMSQPITVPMPSLSFKPTKPGRGYQGRPSMELSKLSSTDGPAPGSSIQPKKVAPLTESGKLGKPSSKARLRNVTVTEEQDVDGSTVNPPLSKRHPSKVTITEERAVDAPPLEAKQTPSNAPILELATPNEEDDEDLDALAPSVRAHKKGKFRSGRLSKRHFAQAEKARDDLLDLSMDSNHSVTYILGSVGLIIGPELLACTASSPFLSEKVPLMKYTLTRYNREKEEHKDDLEAWHQGMLSELVERRAREDLLDTQESAVKNMEIISQKATHLARQVAAVKDINIFTILISRDPTVSQLASIVSSNPRIQQKIDEEEVWVHESLRNVADAFKYVSKPLASPALDKSWIKWEDITLGELMMMSLTRHGSPSNNITAQRPSVVDAAVPTLGPTTDEPTSATTKAQQPLDKIATETVLNSKEDPHDLHSFMKTWKKTIGPTDNTFWAPPKEIIHMTYEERCGYYRRIIRRRLQVDLAILLDVGKLKDFFLHFLYILPLTSGVPERDFVGSKKFFSKIGMGDSDILSLGTAYFAEKPENMPVQFKSWTDEELSHPVDSTEFLLVDIIQSQGWDGPKSRAKVIHSGKYMAEDWSGNPADRSHTQEYTTLNSLTSAMHDLDQPMPDSPGHQDDEGDESDPVPAPVQTCRKATKKPHSRTARHPVAISEDKEDNNDPVPHYTSQPPVAGPSCQPPSVPTPRLIPPSTVQAPRAPSLVPYANHHTRDQHAGLSNVPGFNSFPAVGQQVNPFQPNMPMAPSSLYPQPMPDFNALFAQWMQTQAGAFGQSQTHGQFLQPATRSAPSCDPHFPGDNHNMQ
ncbi:hypothetical protein BKA70DRAFT_1236570 [Coprinopsis sp. MPI-PUGE-AT-0042]|nr:hypothetical protein BKA70DRAFT_1236570 [Coprinopsis sp. MPI-PUGE-AT-0042]